MEARTELRRPGMSKGLVVVIAVCVTLGLGVTAGIVAKNFSSTTAAPAHFVQTTLGPAESTYPVQHSGLQMGDRSGAATDGTSAVQRAGLQLDDLIGAASAGTLGPDAQDRNDKLAAKPTAVPNPRSVKGLRQI